MTIVSEAGFTNSVIEHVKTLHHDTIQLGLLHPTETGLIEQFNVTFLGIERTMDVWSILSIIVQYADDGEIDAVAANSNEEKIFGQVSPEKMIAQASPMDLVRYAEAQNGHPSATGLVRTLNFDCSRSVHEYTYRNRRLRRIIITGETHRRIWEPKTRLFSYSGVYPVKGQRGIAAISTFAVDTDRTGTLTVVFLPDPENISGKGIKVAGQFEFH
jgi:hypothetical protein